MRVGKKMTLQEYRDTRTPVPPHVLDDAKARAIVAMPYATGEYNVDEVVQLNHVSIVYGKRTILKALDWTVHNGEHWALSGQNGAGKSTLLSPSVPTTRNPTPAI